MECFEKLIILQEFETTYFFYYWEIIISLLSVIAGCKTRWDEIGCWLRSEVGQVVNLSCSEVFQHFSSIQGLSVEAELTRKHWEEHVVPSYFINTLVKIQKVMHKPHAVVGTCFSPRQSIIMRSLYAATLMQIVWNLGHKVHMSPCDDLRIRCAPSSVQSCRRHWVRHVLNSSWNSIIYFE